MTTKCQVNEVFVKASVQAVWFRSKYPCYPSYMYNVLGQVSPA